MSHIWKDKIFLACLVVALLSGVGLIYKVIYPIISSRVTSPSMKQASFPNSTVSVKTNVNSPLTYSKGFMDKYPIVKMRPKSGNNEWRVGSNVENDSNDLDLVIANAEAGDLIYISSGHYDFKFNRAFKKLHLIGEEGVILEVKDKDSHIKNSGSLVLEKLQVHFTDNAVSSYLYLYKDISLIIKEVVFQSSKYDFSLNDTSKFEAQDSQFYGISFRMSDSSSVVLNNCRMEKADTFISMRDFSSLKMDKTHLTRFSRSAIKNYSQHTSLKAYDIKVDNGDYAFSGNDMNLFDVSHSSFSKLESLTSDKLKLNCVMCEMSDIQR
jgi:hypothetical protein